MKYLLLLGAGLMWLLVRGLRMACACCGGVTVVCCGPKVQNTLYLHWTSQSNCNYNIPASIPLNYTTTNPFGQPAPGWKSACYYDSTRNCSTFWFFWCAGDLNWRMDDGTGGETVADAGGMCSPFNVTFATVTVLGYNSADCFTGGNCNGNGLLQGVTVTS